jgi:hypothetical protein
MEPLGLDGPDFDRSLPAIDAMTALIVNDVTPGELAAPAALVLEPIVIADLPLTAESFSPLSNKEFFDE